MPKRSSSGGPDGPDRKHPPYRHPVPEASEIISALKVGGVPLTEVAGQHYGEIRGALERVGQTIGNNDLWIAAHALTLGVTLVHEHLVVDWGALGGIVGDALMVRTGRDAYEWALAQPYARPMDFTGRPSRSMVFVDPPGLDDASLAAWVAMGAALAASLKPKG